MTNSKIALPFPTLEERVTAQLKLELDMCVGSAADQGATLDAYLAVRFPPRVPMFRVSPKMATAFAMLASVLTPTLSLAGILFAGLAL